ncbi:hypothetical protein KAU33_04125 [Candidatus Dependentiae bacterium]|nr:hypothetical protein [Candidatus Dependentiae bacterium]
MKPNINSLNTKTCSKCHKTKPLDEFYKNKGRKDNRRPDCKVCNNKQRKGYYQEHKEERTKYDKDYYKKHKDKIRKRQGKISMYENKLCTSYLGVVIAERLVRYLFKDVEVMPNNHSGYDFICNRNKKIDVKSGCVTLDRGHPRWHFNIDHNITADYFILVAFDNRIDLNPLHLWMIPGHVLNKNKSRSIRPSTLHKWDKYKRNIKDAQFCCNELKASE